MRLLRVAFVLSLTLTLLLLAGVGVSVYAESLVPERSLPGAALPTRHAQPQALAGMAEPAAWFPLTQPAAQLSAAVAAVQTPLPPELHAGLVSLILSSPLTGTLPITPTQDAGVNFLPLILRQIPPTPPPEPRKLLVCKTPNLPIPDNAPLGKTDFLKIDDPGQVVDVRAYVRIDHTWVGDLTARVEHAGLIAKLFDRPGVPDPSDGSLGCGSDHIRAIFDDGMAHPAENICFTSAFAPAIGGSFYPVELLSAFFNQPAAGDWGLRVVDESIGDAGTLVEWCLDLTVLDGEPTPTPTPEPVTLPASAEVSGMSGQNQMYMLDCESRSAVDWARHWGFWISEYEFFWGLPTSVNPETGFVGYVDGTWGLVPPQDYGVHAAPIAARLQDYGLNAQARKYLRWDDLRLEIAAGRPVIVWIIDTLSPGAPRYYNPGTGPFTVTAPYEHTMVLVGYTATTVTLLDGASFRTLSLNAFLDSWSALANMAVVYVP